MIFCEVDVYPGILEFPDMLLFVVDLHVEGRLLSCDQSLDRLIGLLDKNLFDSGAHIDFYDLTEDGELITI